MNPNGIDLTAMRAEVASLEEQLTRMQAGYQELQRALAERAITVTAADGTVSVTVDARGHVTDVELDPKIYQRPDTQRLAATITATIQQAVTEVQEQVKELTRPMMPDPETQAQLGIDIDDVFSAEPLPPLRGLPGQ
jgi:DNA-binding YbaB/EbfC family protein